jgi:predicted HD phosphohydrolase
VFSPEEAERFIRQPYAAEGVSVRLWDDAAKIPGAPTPPLEEFEAVLRKVSQRVP